MRYAGFRPRALALIVDLLVWLPLIGLYALMADSRTGATAGEIISRALSLAYPVYLHGRFGQTLGKMAARIQVRLVDGSRMTWRAAWMRSSVDIAFGVVSAVGAIYVFRKMPPDAFRVGFFEWADLMAGLEPAWLRYVGYAAIAWVVSELVVLLLNKKRRALHDFIAGTVVVHVDAAGSRPVPGDLAADGRPA